ncbi:unnamed protein product [Cercopithifilaria johnstoni]|uniref:Protein kinase domain-containing protein n=1 Tax=Cercopithifilaria johnstoni TaxID=2874296 RepID=A0A8J2LZE5_9BILA|nr:unnamed protein product [Cercopithifilaria johnstoni]
MVERSAGTKTRRLLFHGRYNLKSLAQTLLPIDGTTDPFTLFQAQIPQLHNTATECELLAIVKPSLIKLLTLCKDDTYRNKDRCFRVFLLAMKFLSDTNAMKMFGTFYDSKMFTQLSDFYICWAQRCDGNHNFIRTILIKAEKMNAKPKCAIEIRKKQFVIKEEELILSNNDNYAISTAGEKTITYPCDSNHQTSAYSWDSDHQTFAYPWESDHITSAYPWDSDRQTELMNDFKTPNFIKFYNVRSKHQSNWEAYIYHYVEKELRQISGIVQIYHCLTFTDKSLTVQEFTAGTLKELITIQNSGDIKLSELIVAIIILDLMKILRITHQMNIIHGCFRSDNIFVAKRIACKPQFDTLSNGATLLAKLANWDFAIRNTDGMKYSGQYINEEKVITDGCYVRCRGK